MKSKNHSNWSNILTLVVIIAFFIYGQLSEKNDINLGKLIPDVDVEGFIEEGEPIFVKTIRPDADENDKSEYQTPQAPSYADNSDSDDDDYNHNYSNYNERPSITTSEPESSSKSPSPPPSRSLVIQNRHDKKAEKLGRDIEDIEEKIRRKPWKKRKLEKRKKKKEKRKAKREKCANKKRAKRGW